MAEHRPFIFRNLKATVAAVAIAVGLAAAGCSANLNDPGTTASLSPNDPAGTEKKVGRGTKIAMLLPLGGFGQNAVIAKSMKQAGELAIFDLDNPTVQLIAKDDKGTAEGARAAAEEALRDGAEVIVGPLFSQAVAGASNAAKQANVPVIAFSNDRAVAGNGVYLLSFIAEQEVDRIVSFAASQGKKRFAALISDDAFGRTVEPAFQAAVARVGGTIVHTEFYQVSANAMIEPTKRVVAAIQQADESGAPIDALFVPGGQETLASLGPLIAYSGIDNKRVKLLGTGGWDYPNLGRDGVFAGGWYPGPDPRGWRAFSERFAKTFGSAPPRVASLAYDAVSIAVALSSGPAATRFSAESLTRANGFSGVDGQVRLLPSGVSERALAILEVQSFGSSVIDAPSSAPANATASAGSQRLN